MATDNIEPHTYINLPGTTQGDKRIEFERGYSYSVNEAEKRAKLIDEMRKMEVNGFYGYLEIIFEEGIIQRYKKTESVKI